MPGLIDAPWDATLIRPNPAQAIAGDVGYNNIAATVEATDTLMAASRRSVTWATQYSG